MDFTVSLFINYLFLGVIAGLIAGIFGVGGGMVIVPSLIIMFKLYNMPENILTHLAIGTSLATIIITSLSSVRTHANQNNVTWPIFYQLTPTLLLGSFLGVVMAMHIAGQWLQFSFGLFILAIAIKTALGTRKKTTPIQSQQPSNVILKIGGLVIGWISSLFGIGGGAFTVPFLRYQNLTMTQAVGTSSACSIPIAIMGTLTNLILAWNHPNLPQGSTGFIYWPAFFGIIITSIPSAHYGAKIANKLSNSALQKIFALFLLILAIKFCIPSIEKLLL